MNNKGAQITHLTAALLTVALALTLIPVAGGPARAAPMTQSGVLDVVINEVDSDTPSYDTLEFIELYDGGTGNTALDGLVVVLHNGNGDVSYDAFDLDGFLTDSDGYFVIGTVVEADLYVEPGSSGWLQNGADAVALYSGDAADFPNGTPVTTDNLIDALVYDTDDSDDSGLLVLLNPGQPQVNEGGLGDKDHHSNQRCPNGEGGARNTDTYTQFTPTPGSANCQAPPEVCGDPFTPIYDVQGSAYTSPLQGTVVSVEGIVTGDFQGSDELDGFFIQDAGGDGNDATSDGVFVYAPGADDVVAGELVRVRGTVNENYELTEIGYVELLLSCGMGSVDATPIDLPVDDVSDLEPYEGMLVTFPEALSASDHYNTHRYGEVVVSADGRQFNPTNYLAPGPDAADLDGNGIADINEPGRLILDDGSDDQFPATVPYLAADSTLRLGDTVTDLTGVLSYGYDSYRLHPTEAVVFNRTNPRTSAPDDVGGVVKVASFNTLNYWTTIDDGANDARGADSIAEFERQKLKTVAAILGVDADVVGLQELENNGPTAIGDLVAALNDATAPGTWAAVPDPDYPGGLESTNAIKVGIIYRADRVAPVGDPVADDDAIFATDRPPIAQTFDASGEVFTVVVNHFKSKGCTDATGLNTDQGDGQSCYNYRRTLQAEALLDFVADLQTAASDDDVLVIGDLNAYLHEDPVVTLQTGLVNQVDALVAPEDQYSYVYFGQAGLLDHIFTTGSLEDRVTGVDVWHINGDEPRVLDYNDEVIDPAEYYGDFSHDYLYNPDPFRSSDHDPVIVGFCDAVPPVVEVSVTPDTLWPPNHMYVTVHATVDVSDNIDPSPALELVSVTSNEPDNGDDDGDTIDDIVIVDDFNFKLRAERSGIGDGRVYTITYRATDACGNSTVATATVTVPLSQGE